jgi:hypothetical protein
VAGPPPPPESAAWRIRGLTAEQAPWELEWHLHLPGATGYDFASVHRLHEDLLTWSEPFFFATLASTVICTLSRLTVTGPASTVGDELFLAADGSGGEPVPANVAVCVRQLVQASGRGRQGRFYLPPPRFVDTQFATTLKPAANTLLSTQLATLFDGVNANSSPGFPSCRFAVLHRREQGAWLDPAIIQQVDTWVLSRRLSHQDRRLSSARLV